ncbi:hypothetical protein NPIL_221371 [Nephila pilipes]|uniref:Uncharacterized protein n=1 Tax=Nephila pilipes TaxID=299642 RepID=A0A8X6R374_NEPPI|nr:hypothetical protein NPIL_221371 [Nephila pilipes]
MPAGYAPPPSFHALQRSASPLGPTRSCGVGNQTDFCELSSARDCQRLGPTPPKKRPHAFYYVNFDELLSFGDTFRTQKCPSTSVSGGMAFTKEKSRGREVRVNKVNTKPGCYMQEGGSAVNREIYASMVVTCPSIETYHVSKYGNNGHKMRNLHYVIKKLIVTTWGQRVKSIKREGGGQKKKTNRGGRTLSGANYYICWLDADLVWSTDEVL